MCAYTKKKRKAGWDLVEWNKPEVGQSSVLSLENANKSIIFIPEKNKQMNSTENWSF